MKPKIYGYCPAGCKAKADKKMARLKAELEETLL